METFDISKLTDELRNEIKSCNTTEELKALLISKNYSVPDHKLEVIMTFCANSDKLDLDELAQISGGGCKCDSDCKSDHATS